MATTGMESTRSLPGTGKPKARKREVGAAVPYGRMGQPEDLTGMAVFLASER